MNENFSTAKILDSGEVTHGDDSRLHVEFRMEPMRMGAKSEEAGRDIYEEREFIRIMFPGDRTKMVDREANDIDKRRFATQYAAFQQNKAAPLQGTPISEWAPLSKSQVLELQAMRIMTVEQLAGLPDTAIDFFGGRDLRDKAQAWLKSAADGAYAMQLKAMNERLETDLAAKDEQLKAMSARLEALEKGKGK